MKQSDRRKGVRWTVGRMLTAGFAVALLALVVVGASAYTCLGSLIQAQKPVNRTHIVLGSLGKINDLVYLVDRSRRTYFASRGDYTLQLYRDSSATLGRTMTQLDRDVAPDPQARATLAELRGLLDADQVRADRDIADPRGDGASVAERDAQLTRRTDLVLRLRDHETRLLVARLDASDDRASQTRWLIVAVSLGTALFVAAGGRWITLRITSAAHEVTAAAGRVIDGDLTRRAHVTGPVELAQMARAVNASMTAMATARDEAIAATAAKSAFLAAMSHEIRTPMNAVLGGTALLDDSTLSAGQRELVGIVRASAESLLVVINDILDFSKIEAGELDLHEQPVDLRGCVDGAVRLVALTADAKGLRLSVETAADCPVTVVADGNRLRQILVNLLGNAVKFTDRGGVSVAVGVSGGRDDRIGLRMAVRDTGIGIPADRLERLFVAFSQVDDSSTRTRTGTGLGLVISRRLAEAMGGGIEVSSTPGEGSTFTLTAYVRTADGLQVAAAATPAPPAHAPLHLLLAEDNPINQRVAELMLTRRGHRVDIVETGADAVLAVGRTRYDLVLMDVQMPAMDGFEATRRIRAEPPGHGAPRIVALTANATVDDQAAGRAAGMDGFLSKPIQEADLDVVLAAAAGHADTGRRLAGERSEDDNIRAAVAGIAGADFADQARLADILLAFAARLPAVLAELDDAAAADDRPRVDRIAHGLRGSAATLGAERLAAACTRVETTDDLPAALHELHDRADVASRAVIAVSAELTAVD